jgi:hypothetical protein
MLSATAVVHIHFNAAYASREARHSSHQQILLVSCRTPACLNQVVEFYANGTAVEEYRPCTPQQLGLHPRDVVLFAPISRLAAPQVCAAWLCVLLASWRT